MTRRPPDLCRSQPRNATEGVFYRLPRALDLLPAGPQAIAGRPTINPEFGGWGKPGLSQRRLSIRFAPEGLCAPLQA